MTLYIRWFALATLVAGSLSASVPDQAGTGATDRNLMFSSLPPPDHDPDPDPSNLPKPPKPWECPLDKFPEYDFKKCSCPPCKKNADGRWESTGNSSGTAADLPYPRVRKEWREMNDTEIDRYACALNVMSNISTEAGRKCYGRTYVYFPDIVMKHACVASDPRGDQGHRGPEFMLFHKSTLLTYEGSILAIDPKIGAIPWWNMPLDSAPVLNVDGTVKHKAGKYYCPKTDSASHPFDVGSPHDKPSVANPGCDHSKYIWSDTYFGEQLGSGPNFEVTNGRWAYRTMSRWGDFNTTYWSQDDKYGVNNECIINRYFTPQGGMRQRSKTKFFRKNPSFYNLLNLTSDQLNQNCVRCCDAYQDGTDVNCKCGPDDHVDIYMRGPTLDTQTCSPYVTRNPNGRGDPMLNGTVGRTIIKGVGEDKNILFGGNGRSQQDSLIRYTQHDFDTCANSSNTRNWIEWQNCQEENEFGTLEGVYCPDEKESCKQSELKKVYALHSTGHDKVLGEIGDVTTSPSDPALFFSYHAYIDKNFMAWQESMMEKNHFVDPVEKDLGPHDKSDPPDLTNKNYFGYPRQATLEEWEHNVEAFAEVPFIKGMVNASNQRMTARGYIVPVTFKNFDIELWKDLLNQDANGGGGQPWVPMFEPYNTAETPLPYDTNTTEGQTNLSNYWKAAAKMNASDAIAIYEVHAGVDPNDDSYDTKTAQDVYDGSVTDPNFLGPACSSATNVHSPDEYNKDPFPGYQSGKAAAGAVGGGGDGPHLFNPTFSGACTSPQWPSPKPGSLTYKLTQGARTYSTSGPFIYMTQYRPTDFFNRGDRADPTLPWIPGTLLQDIANGGIPFRDIFPGYDGGRFGYSNKEIMEWSMPCRNGRVVNDTDKPCSPYSYSAVQRPFDEIMKSDAYYTDLHNGRYSAGKKIPVCKVFNTKGEASSVLNALSTVSKPCPNECGACCCTEPGEKPPPLEHVCHFPRSEDGTGDCSLYTPP